MRGLTNASSGSNINFDNYVTFGYVTANENIKFKDPVILNAINDGDTKNITTQYKLQAVKAINENIFISIFSYSDTSFTNTYIALQYFVKNSNNWNAHSPVILETINGTYTPFETFGEIFITSNNNLGLEVTMGEHGEYKTYLIALKLQPDTYSYSNYSRTKFGNTLSSTENDIRSFMLWDGMLLLAGFQYKDNYIGNVYGLYSVDITNINNISISSSPIGTQSIGMKSYQIFKINENKYICTGYYYGKQYQVDLFYKDSNNSLKVNSLSFGNVGSNLGFTSIYYYLESDYNNGIFYFNDYSQGILMSCQVNGNSLSGGVIRDTNDIYKQSFYCKKYSSNFILKEVIDVSFNNINLASLLQIGYMRQDMNFNLILQQNSYKYPYKLTYTDSQNIFKGYYVKVESDTNVSVIEYPSFLYAIKDPYGYSPIIAYNDTTKGNLIELKIKVK